jgi:hypothetical protein
MSKYNVLVFFEATNTNPNQTQRVTIDQISGAVTRKFDTADRKAPA